MWEKGYIHLYTGHGKGKTTAALGLAFRAAGNGLKSFIIQYMKSGMYGELHSSRKFGRLITIEQYGSPEFCNPEDKNISEHLEHARKALSRSEEVLIDETHNIIILDEIVTAYLFKLVQLKDIVKLCRIKPESKELVLTGRGASQEIIELCDLVTEMKEVKHYFSLGVASREGIEY